MFSIFLCVLLSQPSGEPIAIAQDNKNAKLVLADVEVAEKTTRKIISGLEKSDFVLNDNGQARELAQFGRETVPLDLVLLVETSAGRLARGTKDLGWELQMIVLELRPDDRVAVMSFAYGLKSKTPLTDDPKIVRDGIGRAFYDLFHGGGETAKIYDALFAASDVFPTPRREFRHRAVLVLTHNGEDPSEAKIEAVTTAFLGAQAVLEGLVVEHLAYELPTSVGAPFPVPRAKKHVLPDLHSIDPIVKATGGEVLHYDPGSQEGVSAAVRRLRSRYLLGFYATSSNSKPEFRPITVQLSEKARMKYPDAIVQSAQGYYTG